MLRNRFEGQEATEFARGGSPDKARWAAWIVAGFLALFTPLNVYYALGGKWGVVWVVGCDCLPAAAFWVQQVAIFVGIVIVLGRAGIWRIGLPGWVLGAGTWGMAGVFGAVSLWNLVGDNSLQARILFAPVAATLCGLCVIVARSPAFRGRQASLGGMN